MLAATPLILAVLGLALLVLEVWAFTVNRRRSRDLSRQNQIVYAACTSVIGVLLLIASLYPEYRVRPGLRLFGVPFVTAAF